MAILRSEFAIDVGVRLGGSSCGHCRYGRSGNPSSAQPQNAKSTSGFEIVALRANLRPRYI